MDNINVWSDDEVARFWNFQSRIPDNYFTFQKGDILVDYFSKYILSDECHDILDYGAGAGFFSENLLKKINNKKLSSCDFSPESVNKENDRCSQFSNFEGAFLVDDLIKRDKKYDLIFCFEVIEHCNDKYLNITFENFRKLLSKNGVVIITTPFNEVLEKSFIECPCCGKIFHRWQHERSWNFDSLNEYISNYYKNVDIFVKEMFITKFQKKYSIKHFLSLVKNSKKRGKLLTYNNDGYSLVCVLRKSE